MIGTDVLNLRRFSAVCALLLSGFLAAAEEAPAPAKPYGRVSLVEGEVNCVRNLKKAALKVGDPVFRLDRVTTGPKSRAEIRAGEGNDILVSEASAVVLDAKGEGPDSRGMLLKLELGKTRCKLDDLKGEEFIVKTPVAVVGVRGTDFVTGFNPAAPKAAAFSVTVLQGAVNVQSALAQVQAAVGSVVVQANQKVEVSGSGAVAPVVDVPPAEIRKLREENPIRAAPLPPEKKEEAKKEEKKEEKKEGKKEEKKDGEKEDKEKEKGKEGKKEAEGDKKKESGAEGDKKEGAGKETQDKPEPGAGQDGEGNKKEPGPGEAKPDGGDKPAAGDARPAEPGEDKPVTGRAEPAAALGGEAAPAPDGAAAPAEAPAAAPVAGTAPVAPAPEVAPQPLVEAPGALPAAPALPFEPLSAAAVDAAFTTFETINLGALPVPATAGPEAGPGAPPPLPDLQVITQQVANAVNQTAETAVQNVIQQAQKAEETLRLQLDFSIKHRR